MISFRMLICTVLGFVSISAHANEIWQDASLGKWVKVSFEVDFKETDTWTRNQNISKYFSEKCKALGANFHIPNEQERDTLEFSIRDDSELKSSFEESFPSLNPAFVPYLSNGTVYVKVLNDVHIAANQLTAPNGASVQLECVDTSQTALKSLYYVGFPQAPDYADAKSIWKMRTDIMVLPGSSSKRVFHEKFYYDRNLAETGVTDAELDTALARFRIPLKLKVSPTSGVTQDMADLYNEGMMKIFSRSSASAGIFDSTQLNYPGMKCVAKKTVRGVVEIYSCIKKFYGTDLPFELYKR